jgi:hypothetical protein
VQEVANECGISVGLCHTILTEKLNMHPVAAKFIPRLPTNEQKEQCIAISQELLYRANDGHYSHSATTLLAGSSTCRPFPVPQAEIHLEMMKI